MTTTSSARVTITIKGVSPLIVNRFTDEAAEAATSGKPAARNHDDTPEQIAERGLYKDDDGNPILPQPNLFSCIIEAGRHVKLGKRMLSTAKQSLIPGYVFFEEPFFVIETKTGWHPDTRPVRIPATQGRILRHRPMFNDWSLTFSIEVDTSELSLKMVRDLIDIAGKRVGLGDFRPSCRGPYGRFVVEHWNEE